MDSDLKKFWTKLLESSIKFEASTSIIIQGPLHARMKDSIPQYLDIVKRYQHKIKKLKNNPYSKESLKGNLIISYWENDNESIIKEYKDNEDIVFIKNKFSDIKNTPTRKTYRGAAPWAYQNYSCLQGCKASSGHLCVKTRSDEFYPSLSKFIDYMIRENEANPSMPFVTCNIYARKDSIEKFHPSDHIIGSTTNRMLNGFRESYNKSQSKTHPSIKFPEQLICRSLLNSIGVEDKDYKSAKIMKEYFRIYPIKNMPNSTWTCSNSGYKALSNPEPGWIDSIDDI